MCIWTTSLDQLSLILTSSYATRVGCPFITYRMFWMGPADIESFDGNPPDLKYFMSTFQESKIQEFQDPRGKLFHLIEWTKGKPKILIKHSINDRANSSYKESTALLQKLHANLNTIINLKEKIKQMLPLKVGGVAAYSNLFHFLIKYQVYQTFD